MPHDRTHIGWPNYPGIDQRLSRVPCDVCGKPTRHLDSRRRVAVCSQQCYETAATRFPIQPPFPNAPQK